MSTELHGVAAAFKTPESFRKAFRQLRAAGYDRIEANVPYAVEGLDELISGKPTPIARFVLAGGVLGGGGGYFLQWFAARDYPYNVGGRPIHSWPAFVPVTFELAVLGASLVGVLALLWLARLPRLDHPLFAAKGFERATQDRFFLTVLANDPKFNSVEIVRLFDSLKAETVEEVST